MPRPFAWSLGCINVPDQSEGLYTSRSWMSSRVTRTRGRSAETTRLLEVAAISCYVRDFGTGSGIDAETSRPRTEHQVRSPILDLPPTEYLAHHLAQFLHRFAFAIHAPPANESIRSDQHTTIFLHLSLVLPVSVYVFPALFPTNTVHVDLDIEILRDFVGGFLPALATNARKKAELTLASQNVG